LKNSVIQGWENIFYGGPHWRFYCYRGPHVRITYIQGCSGVGTAFPHLFLAWERVPTFFALATLLQDVGSKRLH